MQKNTRLESSRRTVPSKRRLRQLLGKRRQDSHCTQGPLKSGKQTALPTFQQPPLLECYKSSNQFLLHLEFVPAHPSFVKGLRPDSRKRYIAARITRFKPIINTADAGITSKAKRSRFGSPPAMAPIRRELTARPIHP